MKPWIKKQLREGLEEMAPAAKEKFGDPVPNMGYIQSQKESKRFI